MMRMNNSPTRRRALHYQAVERLSLENRISRLAQTHSGRTAPYNSTGTVVQTFSCRHQQTSQSSSGSNTKFKRTKLTIAQFCKGPSRKFNVSTVDKSQICNSLQFRFETVAHVTICLATTPNAFFISHR